MARDAARLRALAASGGIAPSDNVTVAAAGSPGLAAARFDTIAAELLRYRVIANAGMLGAVPPNRAILATGRYLVTLPPCPNWSKQASLDFTNSVSSNFGCATAVDFGQSVASPTDLAEGRPLGLTDAIPAAAAVQRYEKDAITLPAATALKPLRHGGAGPGRRHRSWYRRKSTVRAATATSATPVAAKKPDREGVVAVLQDQPTLDRVQGIIRELPLEDELALEPTLDAALRRIREGGNPPASWCLDLSNSTAPIADLSAARSVGGADLKILALGTVNDVGLLRDLLAAGASDYLVKPVSREALAIGLEKRISTTSGGAGAGLGQVVAFIGSRGGVGTTTTAVACAWLLAEQHKEATVLLDLDLHFGTVALNLDSDPGSGLCDPLEQPSRIDALFVDRATVKVSDTLRILAAEAAVAETLMIDAGAINVLLYRDCAA